MTEVILEKCDFHRVSFSETRHFFYPEWLTFVTKITSKQNSPVFRTAKSERKKGGWSFDRKETHFSVEMDNGEWLGPDIPIKIFKSDQTWNITQCSQSHMFFAFWWQCVTPTYYNLLQQSKSRDFLSSISICKSLVNGSFWCPFFSLSEKVIDILLLNNHRGRNPRQPISHQ